MFALSLLLAARATGQVTSGSIGGLVNDDSGAAVPGATVTVTSLETGATRAVTSDNEGRYRIPALQVGRYEVKAELEGFETVLRSGITLTINQEVVVNFQLHPGQLHDT